MRVGRLGPAVLIAWLAAGLAAAPGGEAGPGRANSRLRGGVTIGIDPPSTVVSLDQVFTMDVKLWARDTDVAGAVVRLDFDPAYLRVVDLNGGETNRVIPGSTLPRVAVNRADNAEGHSHNEAATYLGGPPASGDLVRATVRFKAVSMTVPRETVLSFIPGCDVFDGNADSVPSSTFDGIVCVVARPPTQLFLPAVLKRCVLGPVATYTPVPTDTSTAMPTLTQTPVATSTSTVPSTSTATPTATDTETGTSTTTPTHTLTRTSTPTNTPSATATRAPRAPTGYHLKRVIDSAAGQAFGGNSALGLDTAGNVYMSDGPNNRVLKFSHEGQLLLQIAPGYGNEPGRLWAPAGVGVDAAGRIFVAELGNHRVSVFSPTGQFLYAFGQAGAAAGQFNQPLGLAMASDGNLWVAEWANGRIQKLSPSGQYLGRVDSRYVYFQWIDVDRSGYVYATDRFGPEVFRWRPDGSRDLAFGAKGSGDGQFGSPPGVATDDQGNMFVTDDDLNCVQVFDSLGRFLLKFGVPGSNPGEFHSMSGVRVAGDGCVYVIATNRLHIFEPVTPKVLFDEAHSEWISIDGGYRDFAQTLRAQGYIVERHSSGPITAAKLSDYKVYVIATAWGNYTPQELNDIQQFVQGGGGLFLTGLGWSWVNPGEGRTLDNYPMNVVGSRFGLRFLDGSTWDPSNYHGTCTACPVFHQFGDHPVAAGLSQVGGPICPAPLTATLGVSVTAVVFGDDDAYSSGGEYGQGSRPPLVLAVTHGGGRVVAMGHEAYLSTDDYSGSQTPHITLLDNARLGTNIIHWLAGRTTAGQAGTPTPTPSATGAPGLSQEDATSMTEHLEILEDEWLQPSVDVCNAIFLRTEYDAADWGAFFASYFSVHPLTFQLKGYLGYPIIWWWDEATHSKLQRAILPALLNGIDRIYAGHPADLASTLDSNRDVRETLFASHQMVNAILTNGVLPAAERNEVFDWCQNLLASYPEYLRAGVTFDTTARPYLATARAQLQLNLADAVPLAAEVKAAIAQGLGLSGWYQTLWNQHNLLVLDNNGLRPTQLATIAAYLDSLPTGLHDLRFISQNDLLGNTGQRHIDLAASSGVNIFDVDLGAITENGFPSDVPAHYSDVFSLVLAHEVNHVVDAQTIDGSTMLRQRKGQLISGAGCDHLNYLRSMFEDCFFVNAPQEFFASIANQFFANSERTLDLGIARFNSGKREPINQFLFVAEVYSQARDSLPAYTIDTSGNLTKQTWTVGRGSLGRITSIQYGSHVLSFGLDAEGNVVSIQRQ